MAKKSVGLHSELTANATSLVNEYNRADAASKRHSASIAREFEKTQKVLAKGWSLPRFAKQFTKGIGIGSAFGLLDKGFDFLVDLWNKPKEDAKEFAEYLEKALETSRELADQRLGAFIDKNPLTAGDQVNARVNILENQLAEAEKRREQAVGWLAILGERMMPQELAKKSGMSISVADRLATEQMTKAQADIDRLTPAIDKWIKELYKIAEKTDEAGKKVEEAALKADRAYMERIGKMQEAFSNKVQTPLEKFNEEIENILTLLKHDLITGDEARRGVYAAEQARKKEEEPNMSRWEHALGRMQVDEMTRRGMGSGANYQDLQRSNQQILAEIRDILRAAIRNGFAPGYGE